MGHGGHFSYETCTKFDELGHLRVLRYITKLNAMDNYDCEFLPTVPHLISYPRDRRLQLNSKFCRANNQQRLRQKLVACCLFHQAVTRLPVLFTSRARLAQVRWPCDTRMMHVPPVVSRCQSSLQQSVIVYSMVNALLKHVIS